MGVNRAVIVHRLKDGSTLSRLCAREREHFPLQTTYTQALYNLNPEFLLRWIGKVILIRQVVNSAGGLWVATRQPHSWWDDVRGRGYGGGGWVSPKFRGCA